MAKNPEKKPADVDADAAAPALVKARVLISGHFGQINDVVEVTQEESGHPDLDAHPDAVAYAEQLQADKAAAAAKAEA